MTISENTSALVETRNGLKYQRPDVEVKAALASVGNEKPVACGIPHRMRLMETSSEVFPNPTHTHTLCII